MNAYTAQTLINLKLTFRDRMVLFFNYAFPLMFFFMFAGLNNAERGGAIVQVLTMVLTIGVLGTGFFGAGMRAVQERETNILRRFKVAPITPAPLLLSSMVTGLIAFLPGVLVMIWLSHNLYGMPWPRRPLSLLAFLSIGVIAFRALGLIIASVVNSMQESQILIQILYIPMLMLSGATIPLTFLPKWVQTLAQFLPATYLITGMQGILGNNETLAQNIWPALALVLTSALGVLISMKLFRWEKEEKLPAKSKLWILAVLAPFVLMGIYQARTEDNVVKAKLLERQQRRGRTLLIRNVRVFVGDGKVIESGGVLVKAGKIEKVYEGIVPEAKDVKADGIDGSGKTLLPGLIDVHVHLSAPGGIPDSPADFDIRKTIPRELAAYLYSGVTAVKSVGDPLDEMIKAKKLIGSGERQGAELFACGPMFTAVGGHGTEYFKALPAQFRQAAEAQTVRTPKSPAEAKEQVLELKRAGVDGIKAILESGQAGALFNRMDVDILRAVGEEAHAQNLPLVVHTGDAKDVSDALSVGANGIEHGSFRAELPDELFAQMKRQQVTYDPTMTVIDALMSMSNRSTDLLDRPLVQQVGPAKLLLSTRKVIEAEKASRGDAARRYFETAKANLLHAWRSGVELVTGTDAGNTLVIHGPTVQRELQLWVDSGIPAEAALQAATYNAAKLLRADHRIGAIKPGYDATMLLVTGNPVKDIRATESIQSVFFKGERVDRMDLFEQDQK